VLAQYSSPDSGTGDQFERDETCIRQEAASEPGLRWPSLAGRVFTFPDQKPQVERISAYRKVAWRRIFPHRGERGRFPAYSLTPKPRKTIVPTPVRHSCGPSPPVLPGRSSSSVLVYWGRARIRLHPGRSEALSSDLGWEA